MPPKTTAVDVVAKPAVKAAPAANSVEAIKAAEARPKNTNQLHAAVQDELSKEQLSEATASSRNNVEAHKTSSGLAVITAITIVVMALLIVMAYFAYNKSK
jgi:tRNA(Ile2) C34 agmatinyltransferase TiaS